MCDDLELLTTAQAAELWKVSRRTVQRLVHDGEIPSVRIAGMTRIRADVARRISRGEPANVVPTSIERTAP